VRMSTLRSSTVCAGMVHKRRQKNPEERIWRCDVGRWLRPEACKIIIFAFFPNAVRVSHITRYVLLFLQQKIISFLVSSDLLDTLCLSYCNINPIYFQVLKVASSTESYTKGINSNRPDYNIFSKVILFYIKKLGHIVNMNLVY
jgi:hypothetical protein